jgi:WD40 repeat protein
MLRVFDHGDGVSSIALACGPTLQLWTGGEWQELLTLQSIPSAALEKKASGSRKPLPAPQIDLVQFSPDGSRLLCSSSTKQGYVFDVSQAKAASLQFTWPVHKRLSCAAFWGEKLLLSNKVGDVTASVALDAKAREAALKMEGDSASSSSLDGPLVAQHVAIITHMVVCGDRFLVLADDSGKIVVHCLPASFEIQSYCLGHKGPLRCLAVDTARAEVCSFGSDGFMCLSSLESGKVILRSKQPNVAFVAYNAHDDVYVFGSSSSTALGVVSRRPNRPESIEVHGPKEVSAEEPATLNTGMVDVVALANTSGFWGVRDGSDGSSSQVVLVKLTVAASNEVANANESQSVTVTEIPANQNLPSAFLANFPAYCASGSTICDQMLQMIHNAAAAPWKIKKKQEQMAMGKKQKNNNDHDN